MTTLPTGIDVSALMAGFQLAFFTALAMAAPLAGWSLIRRLTS
jgi:hypothetical protein